MENTERLSIKSWVFVLFVTGIPFVGLIYLLFKIFAKPQTAIDEVKRDYCIAGLIYSIALIVLSILISMFLVLSGISF